jgi:hypothetical protein
LAVPRGDYGRADHQWRIRGSPRVPGTLPGHDRGQIRTSAARADDRDGADDHLAEVRDTAEWIGTDRDDYRMCFGPTNVAI